jgi:hypothetical protein
MNDNDAQEALVNELAAQTMELEEKIREVLAGKNMMICSTSLASLLAFTLEKMELSDETLEGCLADIRNAVKGKMN